MDTDTIGKGFGYFILYMIFFWINDEYWGYDWGYDYLPFLGIIAIGYIIYGLFKSKPKPVVVPPSSGFQPNMRTCPNCNNLIASNQNFCPNCGTKVL